MTQTMPFKKPLFASEKIETHSDRSPLTKRGFIALHQTYAWTS
jgi:hypothetical protein